jgi:putative DNA primase/helicase
MNIDDLKSQPRWVCYTAKKIPVDAKSGRNASSTDSSTWTTHDEAEKAVGKYNTVGVGFVLTGDGIVGIDLDACLTSMPDGSVKPSSVAKQALYLTESYSEISPSGKGLHIIGTAKIPEGSRLKGRTTGGDKVEIYETARYFTFTENMTDGASEELRDIQDAVDWLVDELTDAHSAAKPLPNVEASNADYPDAWIKAVMQRRIDAGIRMVADALEGDRHETRIRAGRLLGGYLAGAESVGYHQISDEQIVDMLYGAQIPRTGAQRQERKAIVDGIAYGRRAPLPIPRPPEKHAPIKTSSQAALTDSQTDDVAIIDVPYHHTDVGNGKRLVDATRDKLRYVPEWKTWLVWNGQRWDHTDVHAVKRLAHAVVLDMYKEAGGSLAINADLAKWALKSEASSRIEGMIAEAQPYLVAKPAEFDSSPWLFNCANCVVDLRTMTVIKHDPALMLTKIVNVDYKEIPMSQKWQTFLRTVFQDDTDLIDYVQKAVGYTMTGSTDEHCLFFCYGNGANGKSSFMKALSIIAGDYGTTSSIEALLDHRQDGEGATPMIAALVGKRFAMASEMPEGRKLNESRVKDITGGDAITARTLYGKPFVFNPSHTLWITGNHKPRITGLDVGIWRRLRILPFTATIPEAQRKDPRELEAMFHEESEAILQWMIFGAHLWYQNGLGSCEAVEKATTEYRGEEDIVARFIQQRCVMNLTAVVSKHTLYDAWKEWAEDEGERGAAFKSQRWLVQQLLTRYAEIGAVSHNRTSVFGIGMLDEFRTTPDEARPSRSQMRRGEA